MGPRLVPTKTLTQLPEQPYAQSPTFIPTENPKLKLSAKSARMLPTFKEYNVKFPDKRTSKKPEEMKEAKK